MYFVTGYDKDNNVIFFTDYADKEPTEKRRESLEQGSGCLATCEYKENPTEEDFRAWEQLCSRNIDIAV